MERETHPFPYKLELARAKREEDRVANYQWKVVNIGGENLKLEQEMMTAVPELRRSQYAVRQHPWVWLFANDKGKPMDESEHWEFHRQTVPL
ncbi:MAG: hypothetical protein WAM89_17515 [Terriglobales bacterium]